MRWFYDIWAIKKFCNAANSVKSIHDLHVETSCANEGIAFKFPELRQQEFGMDALSPASAVHPRGRGRVFDSIVDAIGDTPIVRLRNLPAAHGPDAIILAKLEYFSPAASVKDRIGAAMVVAAGVLRRVPCLPRGRRAGAACSPVGAWCASSSTARGGAGSDPSVSHACSSVAVVSHTDERSHSSRTSDSRA